MTSYYDQNLKVVVTTEQLAAHHYPAAVVAAAAAQDNQQLVNSGLYELVTLLPLVQRLLYLNYSYNYVVDPVGGTCSCSYELQPLTLEKGKQALLSYLQQAAAVVEQQTLGDYPLLALVAFISEGDARAADAVSYYRWLQWTTAAIKKATHFEELTKLVIEQEPAFIKYHVT